MKRKFFSLAVALALGVALAGNSEAVTLTFDTPSTPGVTLGGWMQWDNFGGGHLFANNWGADNYIYFSGPTYVNSFQMNELPWENYSFPEPSQTTANMSIEAYDAANVLVWNTTVDLLPYNNWANWLTINVNTADIMTLKFLATGYPDPTNAFWPSIDNMVISGQVPTPEPSTMLLLGSGLTAAAIFRKRLSNLIKK